MPTTLPIIDFGLPLSRQPVEKGRNDEPIVFKEKYHHLGPREFNFETDKLGFVQCEASDLSYSRIIVDLLGRGIPVANDALFEFLISDEGREYQPTFKEMMSENTVIIVAGTIWTADFDGTREDFVGEMRWVVGSEDAGFLTELRNTKARPSCRFAVPIIGT